MQSPYVYYKKTINLLSWDLETCQDSRRLGRDLNREPSEWRNVCASDCSGVMICNCICVRCTLRSSDAKQAREAKTKDRIEKHHVIGFNPEVRNLKTVGRTLWMGDQSHRKAATYPCLEWGSNTHDLSVSAGAHNPRPRLRGHCDRQMIFWMTK
jgi:hypothetical protein